MLRRTRDVSPQPQASVSNPPTDSIQTGAPEQAFSVEVWSLASSDERDAWDGELQQLWLNLPTTSTIVDDRQSGYTDLQWEQGMRELSLMLQQLENANAAPQ